MEKTTIEILLDNNAIKDIANLSEYENILGRLDELSKSAQLRTHFNLHSFIEQIEGPRVEEHFKKAQARVQKAAEICNKSLLLPEEPYLKECLGSIGSKEVIEEINHWKGILNDFCNCTNFEEFEGRLGPLRNFTLNDKREWYDYGLSIKKKVSSYVESIKSDDTKIIPFYDTNKLRIFRQTIFNNLIQRHNLKWVQKLYPKQEEFVKKAISLCYQSDIYIYYFYLRDFEGHKSKQSDYVDLAQVIYLDKCDYIVTNDKNYRNLINKCPFCDLKGRAISLDELLEQLKKLDFRMPKRAIYNMCTISFN